MFMIKLLIATLKKLAIDWFMKLQLGPIRTIGDLEDLFLDWFFDDDSEVAVTSLLEAKQKNDELIKAFIERFR